MKKLVLLLFVSSTFAGLGFSSLSASVIKDGIVLASNDKCGGEKKRPISGSCGDSKCGDEEMPMYKKQKDSKCGSEKKSININHLNVVMRMKDQIII